MCNGTNKPFRACIALRHPWRRSYRFDTGSLESFSEAFSELRAAIHDEIAIEGEFPYVYLGGVVLKRSWAGEVRNVSVLVAIGVGADGYPKILSAPEGHKEDRSGWRGLLRYLKERGRKGIKLIISDACLGLQESILEYYPGAQW